MAAPAMKVGRGKCPCCRETVTFRKSKGGLLTYSCDNCDSSGYAQPGGTAFAAWEKTIAGPAPSPAPAGDPPPPAPPAPKAGFSMDKL